METRASYVLVGAFVLGLAAAALFFVFWLGGSDGGAVRKQYAVHFSGNVTGLQPGAPVRFRGIPKGEVKSIGFRRDDKGVVDPDIIRVIVSVDTDTPVMTDTVASLEVQGLTGSPFVQLKRGDAEQLKRANAEGRPPNTPLKPGTGPRDLHIPGESSGMERIFEEFPKAIASVTDLANRAAELLNKENQEEIARLLKSSSEAMTSLNALAGEATRTVQSLETTAKDASDLAKRGQATMAEFDKGAVSVVALANEMRGLVRENRRPIADFAATGLYEFSLFLTDMRKWVRTFDRILTRLEGDPSNFLFGNRQRGFETPADGRR
jgi:phospholipid/cholesterol/gamma-HCH transport system substrate-binding protein